MKKEKNDLKDKMSEAKKTLVGLCADTTQAKALIKDIISYQKQMDIEPTELYVPVKEVLTDYDFGAFHLLRCKTCIIFKTTGYRLVAKPVYNANHEGGILYSHLSAICDMKDRFKTLNKETQDLLELVFNLTITILSLPIDAFADDKFLFDVGTFIVKKKNEMYEAMQKKIEEMDLSETEEDEIKNDEFRQEQEMLEDAKNDLKKMKEDEI